MSNDRIIINKIIKFRNERGWEDSDKPETLAKSIFIEASELLINYQWENECSNSINIKEELADVLMYSFAFAHDMGFNVTDLIIKRLEQLSNGTHG